MVNLDNITTRGKNYERVYDYMMLHPFAKQIDCAEDLELSQNCVSRHYKKMHAKWKAQRVHDKRRLKLIKYNLDVGESLLATGLGQ